MPTKSEAPASATRHTPGKWELDEFFSVSADAQPIADVRIIAHRGYALDTAERKANARLIAASPDLLEAARMAHEFITRIANTMPVAANGESLTLIKLSAAIAKAEGL